MDLLLSKDSVRNCTMSLPNGQPIYEVSTPSRYFHTEQTTIKRLKGQESRDMALIELHGFHDDVCQVWGKDMVPKSDGLFKSGKTFTASDGKRYTWKIKLSKTILLDQFENTIAVFENSHTGFFSGNPRQAQLSISEGGLSIADDIVATFVLVDQRNRQNQRTAAASSAAASSNAAVAAAVS
ncbi:hypothetical protein Moror_16903 [Moniliophthora roreri MCA 2997]|uniref:DUF6593 domain-containing protein n=2 Tax=Moniliophthora roreri TaxID=221103 RepID=V2XA80_MONRO|nr:hypothetical protein Moror_16903 [Moniliophthora roreri MCA 2997]KAI3596395.1 hypothetical protein WG66_003109 [Moniliophthora roreri]